MEKLISLGGINWTWYAKVTIIGDKATILLHDRLHNDRDRHPKSDGCGYLIEDEKRNVTAIVIDGQKYAVTNPQHIFSYSEFSD